MLYEVITRFLFALSSILCAATPFADELDRVLSGILPEKTVTELRERGTLQHSSYRNASEGLALAPNEALAAEAASFWEGDASYNFV